MVLDAFLAFIEWPEDPCEQAQECQQERRKTKEARESRCAPHAVITTITDVLHLGFHGEIAPPSADILEASGWRVAAGLAIIVNLPVHRCDEQTECGRLE